MSSPFPPPGWQNPQQPTPPRRMDYRTKRALWVIAGFVGLVLVGGGIAGAVADPKPTPTAQAGDAQRFIPATSSATPAVATVTPVATTVTPAAPRTVTPTTARPAPSTLRPTTARPKTTAPKPRAATKKPKPRPTTTTKAPANTGVHAGAFCKQHGEYGRTDTGKRMQCTTTAKDSRYRWRAA